VEERQDGSSSKTVEERTLSFPSWAAATSCSLQGASIKRLSKLYLLLRGKGVFGVARCERSSAWNSVAAH